MNKKIISGIVLFMLLELPKIAFAQYVTDNYSPPNLFWKTFAFPITLFIFIGIPLLVIILFFAVIYIIVKKVKDNKKI